MVLKTFCCTLVKVKPIRARIRSHFAARDERWLTKSVFDASKFVKQPVSLGALLLGIQTYQRIAADV